MGYKDNKIIYNENISRLENFVKENPTVESQKDKELVLLLPKDEKYGFTAITCIEWIDSEIKKYFDTELNFNVLLGDINKTISEAIRDVMS